MFQTVLSNKDHMEYGVVTVPFPMITCITGKPDMRLMVQAVES